MPRQIKTDKKTYDSYIKAGMWIPQETPQFFKLKAAIVKAKVQLKPRRGEVEMYYDEATITITNYYN